MEWDTIRCSFSVSKSVSTRTIGPKKLPFSSGDFLLDNLLVVPNSISFSRDISAYFKPLVMEKLLANQVKRDLSYTSLSIQRRPIEPGMLLINP